MFDAVAVTGFVVALVAGYFAMPPAAFQLASTWKAYGLVVLAILLLLLVYARGLRHLRASRHPLWRALSLVVVIFVTVVVVFAYGYLSLEARYPGQVPGLETHIDALYFTITMLATVGFGDIAPAGQFARGVATLQMIFNLAFLGFVLRTAIAAGRRERRRRERQGATASP